MVDVWQEDGLQSMPMEMFSNYVFTAEEDARAGIPRACVTE